jgi:hypothetical protein
MNLGAQSADLGDPNQIGTKVGQQTSSRMPSVCCHEGRGLGGKLQLLVGVPSDRVPYVSYARPSERDLKAWVWVGPQFASVSEGR